MSPILRTASLLLLAPLGFLILHPSCSSPPDYSEMTEKEKAAKIKDLREEAERQRALYSQSNDLTTLERLVELERESTKVSPTSCGFCFFRYGLALRYLGNHYNHLFTLFDRDLKEKNLSEDEKLEYADKARKYHDLAKDFIDRSNEQLQIYLASGEPVDPRAYELLSEQYDYLEDYQKALYYLDLLAGNLPAASLDQKNLEARRKRYQELMRRQEEKQFERELEREPSRKTAPRSARAESAN